MEVALCAALAVRITPVVVALTDALRDELIEDEEQRDTLGDGLLEREGDADAVELAATLVEGPALAEEKDVAVALPVDITEAVALSVHAADALAAELCVLETLVLEDAETFALSDGVAVRDAQLVADRDAVDAAEVDGLALLHADAVVVDDDSPVPVAKAEPDTNGLPVAVDVADARGVALAAGVAEVESDTDDPLLAEIAALAVALEQGRPDVEALERGELVTVM